MENTQRFLIMCTVLFFPLTIFFVTVISGQKVEYRYDSSGNRIRRSVIVLSSSSSVSVSSVETDTDDELPVTRSSSPEDYDTEQQHYEDFLGERRVVIYPNPTRGLIRIDFQGYGEMDNARLLLYNMQGRLLHQENRVEQYNILDLSSYTSGMYILHLIEGTARSQWKLIKE